jgi:hypothetical protein
VTDKTAARIALLAALMVFGFALVPVAFGDKGGNPNGGNGGGATPPPTTTTSLSTTTTTTPATSTTTSTTTTIDTTTTTSAGNGKAGGKGGGGPQASGSGGSTGGNSSPLVMTSEYISWPDTWEPNCITEDDTVQRVFAGSLDGSYATSFQLCNLSIDGWTAGGEGIQSKVGVSGTLSDLTITAPDGTVTHGVYTGTEKGISYYEVCVMPPFYASTDTGTNPLAGGTWTVILSGSLSSVSWQAQVTMAWVFFQQANCPASQQNIIS